MSKFDLLSSFNTDELLQEIKNRDISEPVSEKDLEDEVSVMSHTECVSIATRYMKSRSAVVLPEFNQASKDELRTLGDILSQAFIDGASDTMWQNDRYVEIYATAKKELQALIRTEKLKLLDEVIHQSTVNLKSAKAVAGWAELRKEQLEAEL